MIATPTVHSKLLLSKKSPEAYETYRAALEWDLTDPIVMESASDLQSEPSWRGRLDPYHHQITNLVSFCRRLPVALLADEVGLGKTISAGLIASELIARSRVSRVLVVSPKLICEQWQSELREKFGLPAEIALGRWLLQAEPAGPSAVITTYNSARLYLDRIPSNRFEMLILDEAHRLRNLHGAEPPPQVAQTFRRALEERRFHFVVMLTATPIQNRLWDIYSLVDLLSIAREHPNPFGGEGQFARRFIADRRETARQLRPEAREAFRSVVHGCMSRVRRIDAKLAFPERRVLTHGLHPTAQEIQLIEAIAGPIRRMNRLAQISLLEALTSSPDALLKQLENMTRNGTAPPGLAERVRTIVGTMTTSAKLLGLGQLIEQLEKADPTGWRLTVFTGRRETQTTIQAFLEAKGLKVGIINGQYGGRNQETIKRFQSNPPDCRIVVSTDAGSEGVNFNPLRAFQHRLRQRISHEANRRQPARHA